MEIEMMYYADYKQFLITLENHLSSINQYQQNQISIEQLMNQLELGDQQKPALILDNIYQIICDQIYWILRFVPTPALYD